jgi:hypothetical protein
VLLGALYRAGTARRGGGEEIWRLSVVEALKLQCASYGEREGYLGEEIVGGGGQTKNRGSVGDEPGGWRRETWQRLSWIGSIGFMTGGRGQ